MTRQYQKKKRVGWDRRSGNKEGTEWRRESKEGKKKEGNEEFKGRDIQLSLCYAQSLPTFFYFIKYIKFVKLNQ